MFLETWLFISGLLFTWPALVVLLLLGITFEHKGARGWAVFTGIVSMIVSYFYFNVALESILYYALAYLIVGIVWSFWRYNGYVKEQVAYIKSMSSKAFSADWRQTQVDNLAPTKNLDRITAWILIWPFSAVENIAGDIINAVQALVTKVFKGVYHKIYLSHVTGIALTPVEE